MRSLAKRLLRKVKRVTRRQFAVLLASAVLAGALAAAAVLKSTVLTIVLACVLGACLAASAIQTRRRISQVTQSVKNDTRRLQAEVETANRRLLAAVETERLAAADRNTSIAKLLADNRTAEDAGRRRVIGALENERLAAADRHRAVMSNLDVAAQALEAMPSVFGGLLKDSVATTAENIAASQRAARESASVLQREQVREVEALLQLYRDFRPSAPMPPAGGWALSPSGLLELAGYLERAQPKLVVELGSGTSTVWIAYALRKSGGRLISVDHKEDYARRTQSLLSLHALDDVGEVRLADLTGVAVNDREQDWYDVAAFADLTEIDVLIVDGPPRNVGKNARYPAFPILEQRLAAHAVVVVDDAKRPEERDIVHLWMRDSESLSLRQTIFDNQVYLNYSRRA